jgi:hypothetical protein
MKGDDLGARRDSQSDRCSQAKWLFVGTTSLLALVAALVPKTGVYPLTPVAQVTDSEANSGPSASRIGNESIRPYRFHSPPGIPAEQIVAGKLARFVKTRREIVRALARRDQVPVPALVEQYFDNVEAGRGEEALAVYEDLNELHGSPAGNELRTFWRAIAETQGTVQQVQTWPAQKLLDYGTVILGALRPGMVYLGGTDSGCFIPLMLNETGDGEQHIMLTQNALADRSYLDYFSSVYGTQLRMPAAEDSERALADYMADAQKRLLHDQSSPNEPKQVLPGENISMQDGKLSGVSGMLVNERLLQRLMQLNPGFSFALQESFPFKSTYAWAAPLGPVMELQAADQNALTADTAAQTVAFWQNTIDQLMADPEAVGSITALNAYAKMMVGQASLLMSHNFSSDSEQTLRLAEQLAPGNPEVVFSYVQFLTQENRFPDALRVAASALRAAPENQQFKALKQELQLRVPYR